MRFGKTVGHRVVLGLVLVALFGAMSLRAQEAPEATPEPEMVPEAAAPPEVESPPPVAPQPPVVATPPRAERPEAATTPRAGETPEVRSLPEVEADIEESVWLNVQDGDIRDIIQQISQATGRSFIIDDRLRGRKVTILSQRQMTKGEAYQAFLSALNVAGYTVVEGPGGILKVVDINEAKKYPIPTHVDTIPITDNFITRLVTLRNVGAVTMMTAIRDMLSRGGTISVYDQTNTLIITDSGTNIDRLMKIIKELDAEGPQQVLEIIPVKNASAKEVAGMVDQLFSEKEKNANKPKPGEPVDITEVSKLIPDERTNSIIVLASKRAIGQVRELIGRLDRKLDGGEGKIHVYYLKYAKAKDLSATLATLTQGAGQPKPAAGGAAASGGGLVEFEGGIKIAPDESLNALIITATHKDYTTLVDRVISKLDVLRRQVYLEAIVMELRIDKSQELGASGHGGFGGAALGFGQSFGAISQLQGALGGGAVGPGTIGPALLGGLVSQRTVNIPIVDATGAARTVSIPAFSAFINAVATHGTTNIISTPNILTLDNQEATISVEQEEPTPGEQTITSSGIPIQGAVKYEKAGLVLKITPQIGHAETVNLKIDQELSTFGARVDGLNAPSKVKRKVTTNVLCQDGQTIVIGGLMQDEVRNSKQKIPLLGDIPLLGFFFSHTQKDVQKSNLLVFITPYVVKDSTDFSEILKNKIEQRNRFIQDNYGKRQQEMIRASIKTHREDLLEFREELLPEAPPLGARPVSTPLSPTQRSLSPQLPPTRRPSLPPPLGTPPPVISVPPLSAPPPPQTTQRTAPSAAPKWVPGTESSSSSAPIVEKSLPADTVAPGARKAKEGLEFEY